MHKRFRWLCSVRKEYDKYNIFKGKLHDFFSLLKLMHGFRIKLINGFDIVGFTEAVL